MKKYNLSSLPKRANHPCNIPSLGMILSLLDKSIIELDLEGEEFDKLTIKKIQRIKKDRLISPVISSKRKTFRDHYNAILSHFFDELFIHANRSHP